MMHDAQLVLPLEILDAAKACRIAVIVSNHDRGV